MTLSWPFMYWSSHLPVASCREGSRLATSRPTNASCFSAASVTTSAVTFWVTSSLTVSNPWSTKFARPPRPLSR